MKAEYTQDVDSCDYQSNGYQSLFLKTDDAGDGKFFIIETTRWAFDSIDELISVLKDFEKRVNGNSK